MKIGKREAKILIPAVLYGWAIEKPSYRKTAYWDDDPAMPVTIGPIIEKLIDNGFLQRAQLNGVTKIRATQKSKLLVCANSGCYRGSIIDEYGNDVGSCPNCSSGLILTNNVDS